tara:strand:- start:3279 stop:3464 length:186 start_codon:yes stop_codon:yes gene_type:complete
MPIWLRTMTFQKLKEHFDAQQKSQNPKGKGEIDIANPDKSKIPSKKTISPPSYIAKKSKKQ